MKKFLSITVLLLIGTFVLFAQNSASSANKNTALRCLKLAENCLVAEDWNNAIKQADLGLTYDNTISDLIYVKAAAQMNLGNTKNYILKVMNDAFEKNNWVGYTKTGARILLADLLSDTGKYEESLHLLDSDPLIYSADAEFIRVKNFYRMGTMESVNNARLKINSARRIYPMDERFPEIFFLFESMFLKENAKNGIAYELPEIVQNISAAYIAKLPDYSGKNPLMELLASFFANDDEKNRLVRAIDAKNQTVNPILAYAGLKVGLYTEQQALDLFFKISDDSIYLDILELLITEIKDPDVQKQIIEKMVNFSGYVYIDENFDLQNEITIQYELGRPQYIKYDKNNDGEIDLYSSCDFGAPLFVYFNENKCEVFYDGFPKVSKVSFLDEGYVFNFHHDDFTFSPFSFLVDNYFEKLGIEFYIPEINKEIAVPSPFDMVKLSSSVELPVDERENATVVFISENSQLVFANYFVDNVKYAYCDFSTGLPYARFVDYDNDGFFETHEIFDILNKDIEGFNLEEEKNLVNKIFTKAFSSENIYLKQICIDRNANTFYEFSEQYFEYNGKSTLWDNDDNGIWDCQYIKYPKKEGESLVEETIYYGENGLPVLSINIIDGVPVKIISDNQEVIVYAGNEENLYWIGEKGPVEYEKQIVEYAAKKTIKGAIDVMQINDERISVIKVDKNCYCRILPPVEKNEEN